MNQGHVQTRIYILFCSWSTIESPDSRNTFKQQSPRLYESQNIARSFGRQSETRIQLSCDVTYFQCLAFSGQERNVLMEVNKC